MLRRDLLFTPAAAQIGEILDKIRKPKPGAGGLTDQRIVEGFREALRIGTGNAVNFAGRVDGYFAHAVIKILMPEKLKNLEKGLRAIGMGKTIDQFVLSMNRAAEAAAPQAREIFLDAVKRITFADAKRLLANNDTAVTAFFKDKTTQPLTIAFSPIVKKAMEENQVARGFQNLLKSARFLPMVKVEAFDLESYVVGKALDGLFFLVGEEERKIRRDPAARVTAVLREVFSGRSAP
jgi:hypothetical protein